MGEFVPEQKNEDEQRIPRSSPVISARIGRCLFRFDYGNTLIYTFPAKYSDMNHIYYRRLGRGVDQNTGSYLFDSQEVVDELRKHDFPDLRYPWPSDDDLINYELFQSEKLESELAELGNPRAE